MDALSARLFCIALFIAAFTPVNAAPKIEFDKTEFDAGKAVEGEVVPGTFTFRNAGDALLKVGQPDASCNCTVASVTPRELKPGEIGTLNFTFDLTNIRGETEKHIYVPSNDPQSSNVTLTVKASVTALFEYNPQLIFFGDVAPGENIEETVRIKRLDGKPLKISKLEVSKNYISVTNAPDATNASAAELRVTAQPTGKPGAFTDMLKVFIGDASRPTLLIPIGGQLMGGVTVEPAAIKWLVPDEAHWTNNAATTVRSLVVTATEADANFEPTDFESTFENLLVQVVPIQPGKKYRVLLKLDAPLDESEEGELTFDTGISSQPTVTVPIVIAVKPSGESPDATP